MYFQDVYDDRHDLIQKILFLSNRLQTSGDLLYEEFSAKQWYLLCYVDGFGDAPPTLKELSERMGTSHQNTKQMASKLEQKGYLQFLPDPKDRRKIRVHLTEKCDPLWEKYWGTLDRYVRRLFQGISPQQLKASLETLQQLTENVRL